MERTLAYNALQESNYPKGKRVMNMTKTTIFAGSLMMCASALATATYTYENDDKTYVATVTDADTAISQAAIGVLNSNAVTNFIKRGTKTLKVYSNGANAFTGDVVLETGAIQVGGQNPLGPSGKIMVNNQRALVFDNATVAKDVLLLGATDNENTKISVWAGTSRLNGKLLLGGTSKVVGIAYAACRMTLAGGVEIAPGSVPVPYFLPTKGSTFVFENKPINIATNLFITPKVNNDYPLASDGFGGRFVFAVADNNMKTIGASSTRIDYADVKTTVDWAFNKGMTVYFGHDTVWDLCGTSQRIGQVSVPTISSGNKPTVITNSFPEPATLYMGMPFGPNSSAPNIRIGGNLSVVFEKNIWETKINYPMTAAGDLIIKGNGTGGANSAILNFLSNGSWANATNVVVEGVGKIKIANPNALGRKANVNLKANSSLEISSGVTVTVRTLTVNGEQKKPGDYTFGSGTLHVTGLPGFILVFK